MTKPDKRFSIAIYSKSPSRSNNMIIFLGQGKVFQSNFRSALTKYDKAYEKLFKEISNEDQVLVLPFVLELIKGKMLFFQPDRLHPIKKGTEVISKELLRLTSHLIKLSLWSTPIL